MENSHKFTLFILQNHVKVAKKIAGTKYKMMDLWKRMSDKMRSLYDKGVKAGIHIFSGHVSGGYF